MKDKFVSWEEAVLWLKSKNENVSLVKDAFFDDPIHLAAERFYNSSEWAAQRKYLPKTTGHALDIGSGRGIASYALSREGWETTALEPDPSDIVGAGAIRQLIKETGASINIVEDFGEKLPFKDESFQLVYCRQALHHANDLQKICNEICRVLKPNGTFIASREHVINCKEDLHKFLEIHPLHRLYGGEYAYELKVYVHAITSSGITLTKILNPFESNINLYPNTKDHFKSKIQKRLQFIPIKMIPDVALRLIGYFDRTPGRLYSFIGKKLF